VALADRYEVMVARPARRALAEELSVKVATAAWELIDGALRDQPRRVGDPLYPPFAGQWVARRSTYRIRYRIDDDKHAIVVLDIAGRPDVYRPAT
jgi:mRNA interferase RelE/StbE